MIKKDLLDMAEELRQILGSIDGATRIEENFALSYIVVVDDDTKKEKANAVSNAMISQAESHGLDLDITVATEKEVQETRDKLVSYMKQNSTFGEA